MIIKEAIRFYGYLKKDFLLLIRRRKYLFLSILIPLILAIIFLTVINPSPAPIKIGICDFDNTQHSKESYHNINSFEPVILPIENCEKNLISKIKSKELPIGIKIEKGFSENLQNLKQSKVGIFYDNTDFAFSNLLSWKIDNSLDDFKRDIINNLNHELKNKIEIITQSISIAKKTPIKNGITTELIKIEDNLKTIESLETEFIIRPIYVEHKPIYTEKNTQTIGLTFIFPIIALFIILMLSSTSLIYDFKNNFITRVKVSTSILTYLFAKITFFIIITLGQFLIIFLLFWAYGGSYSFNILNVLNLILFIGIINTLIGLLIGLISDNEGIAILFSLFISFPLMLLSGMFYPTQTMPLIFQYIGKILPLYHQINYSKMVLLFDQSIGFTWIYPSIILFIIVYYVMRTK